jgi:hypothetical protein
MAENDYSKLSPEELTLENLAARLRRLEQEFDLIGDAALEDCGSYSPCKKLKSCGSFHIAAPTSQQPTS